MQTNTDRGPFSEVKLPLRNRRRHDVKLVLEPWGETFTLRAGASVQLVARGPSGNDTLEVVWEEDRVMVYGWPGSVVQVFQRGAPLGARIESHQGTARAERLPVPRIPDGMRVREWCEAMTG